jgi:hypothetical protein
MVLSFYSPTEYVICVITEYLKLHPGQSHYMIPCKPDLVFNHDQVIQTLKSLEGWNRDFKLFYHSDSPCVSVKDDFARERHGTLIIN